jgi:hypothetical protein
MINPDGIVPDVVVPGSGEPAFVTCECVEYLGDTGNLDTEQCLMVQDNSGECCGTPSPTKAPTKAPTSPPFDIQAP